MKSISALFQQYLSSLVFIVILCFAIPLRGQGKELSMHTSLGSSSKVIHSTLDSSSYFPYYFDDTITLEKFINNKTANAALKQTNSLYNLGKQYFDQSKYLDAQLIFQKVIAKGNPELDWKIIAGSHNYLSLIATFNKDYMEVYYHNKKLYKFGEKYSPVWHAIMNLNLGTFYLSMDDLALAEEMYNRGIDIFQKVPKQSEYGWLLHRLGELQRIKDDHNKARITLQKALNFWEQTNNSRGKSFTLLQLGELFTALDQPVKAEKFLLEGLVVAEKNDFWLSQISILISLGNLAGKQKNHQEAIQYLEKSADLSIQINIPYYFNDSYQLLAENYEAIGKIQAANKNYQDYLSELEKTVKLNQSTTKEWAKNLDNLNAKEQAYNLLKETEGINKEKLKLQQAIIAAALLIIALTIWIAYSYFKTSQRNISQKENLEYLNRKIQEQANQLSLANENITTQKKALQIELVKKLLLLNNHSESVKSIEQTLEQMDISKETLGIKKLLANSKDDSLWNELDIQLTQSNTDFFKKLSNKYPKLTKGDLRLSALLKMNLSTKEIANLTFKNPESVKVARSRLRKKLGLTHSKAPLASFLNQI